MFLKLSCIIADSTWCGCVSVSVLLFVMLSLFQLFRVDCVMDAKSVLGYVNPCETGVSTAPQHRQLDFISSLPF
jgi:hypothetical protein